MRGGLGAGVLSAYTLRMASALVADDKTLASLIERLSGQQWLALDTEFVRAKTYYARLCLVQVAVPGYGACVDPLADDIAPLLDLLYSPLLLKVLHSARQDIEVLAPLRGTLPGPVFDTQIAAALAGYAEQIGYAALVEEVTGVRLEKRHTRAEWDHRPLSAEELRYAEDDVRYLCEVYPFLARRIADLGREAWLAEECAALLDPARYRTEPEAAFRRLKVGVALPDAAQTRLAALAAWRERAAQAHDLPRHWVVPDMVLIEVARRTPTSLAELSRIPGAGGAVARKWGGEILAALATANAPPPQRLWEEPVRLDRAEQALLERMTEAVKRRARALGVSPAVLATRRDLVALVRHGDSPLLRGWRREVIGAELTALGAAHRQADTAAAAPPGGTGWKGSEGNLDDE